MEKPMKFKTFTPVSNANTDVKGVVAGLGRGP